MEKKNWKIFTLNNGFYLFGEEVQAEQGYIKFINGAMFGGFSGGKGMPGVARGDKDAKITLDRFGPDQVVDAPMSAVTFIVDSINLYESENTTIR